MKKAIYTIVPIDRLSSIMEYGLLPNDKLNELNIENKLKEVNFDETEIGYIYGSTCIRNAIDWYKVIKQQIGLPCVILKYEIDASIIEQDACSPHQIKSDVRFKGVTISPKNITIIGVKVYKDYYTDFGDKNELPLLELGRIEPYLIDDTNLSMDIYKKTVDDLDKYKDGIYYTVTTQEGVDLLRTLPQLDYTLIAALTNIEDFEKAGRPATFTTDIENAIAWKNIVEHLLGSKARILKCSIKNSVIADNYTGINNQFSNVKILKPVSSKSVIEVI